MQGVRIYNLNMCGIIGYLGKKQALPIVLEGLRRLDYRGYDSCGIAVRNGSGVHVIKDKGRIADLRAQLAGQNWRGTEAIGHTRWSTHGAVTKTNAHPHWDCRRNVFVVHNGIIENYAELKQWLASHDHHFRSQTDTEVLAHLIEHVLSAGRKTGKPLSLEQAVRVALSKAKGAYALVVMSSLEPDKLVLGRLSSPLVVGLGKGEAFIASDTAALLNHTRRVIYLDDGELGVLSRKGLEISKIKSNARVLKAVNEINDDFAEAKKGRYAHFMLKEIMEQPEAIENTFLGRLLVEKGSIKLGGLEQVKDRLEKTRRILIIACGTAYYAGLVGKYLLEEIGRVEAQVELASEFRYRAQNISSKDTALAISQSGETADTLAALRHGRSRDALTLGIINVPGSTIARESDSGVYTHAGQEVAVASTKAFSAQLAVLVMLAVMLGSKRGLKRDEAKKLLRGLSRIPSQVRQVLKQRKKIKDIAHEVHRAQNMFIIGRRYQFPIALEGAIKVKEIAYIHAEGFAGGELKHGPIALITRKTPTIALAPRDSVFKKNLSNIEEIKSRRGPVFAVSTPQGAKPLKELVDGVLVVPKTLESLQMFLTTPVLQLLAYELAVLLRRDVDRPRNLAKSVTVE